MLQKTSQAAKVGEAQLNKKKYTGKRLKPYIKEGVQPLKFKAETYQGTGASPEQKEEVRNANRSRKKGVRQKAKLDIMDFMQFVAFGGYG